MHFSDGIRFVDVGRLHIGLLFRSGMHGREKWLGYDDEELMIGALHPAVLWLSQHYSCVIQFGKEYERIQPNAFTAVSCLYRLM